MSTDSPYVSSTRWPAPWGHLEEFTTLTGHGLTVDHSKGDRIEEKYAELQQKMRGDKKLDEPNR